MTLPAENPGQKRRFRPRAVELSRGRLLPLDRRVLLMGVINVTTDSFFAGSRTPEPDEALDRALRLVEEGADIIDIGGESTRPGSDPVSAALELERVLPVIERLRKLSPIAISVDTCKAEVARAAITAGADLVNDISGLTSDPSMPRLIAATGVIAVLNHMRGTPKTMQEQAHYEDVVLQVKAELGARIAAAARAGIDPDRMWIDPGIGFAKTARHNLEILARLEEFQVFEIPVVLGTSRKSFLGKVLGEDDPAARLEGSLATAAIAVLKGAHVLRVHDVVATRRAVRVVEAILDHEAFEG